MSFFVNPPVSMLSGATTPIIVGASVWRFRKQLS